MLTLMPYCDPKKVECAGFPSSPSLASALSFSLTPLEFHSFFFFFFLPLAWPDGIVSWLFPPAWIPQILSSHYFKIHIPNVDSWSLPHLAKSFQNFPTAKRIRLKFYSAYLSLHLPAKYTPVWPINFTNLTRIFSPITILTLFLELEYFPKLLTSHLCGICSPPI